MRNSGTWFVVAGVLLFASHAMSQNLTVAPAAVTFTVNGDGKLPAAQLVRVTASTGTPTITVTPDPLAPWLVVTPLQGKVPVGLTLRVNPSSLSARTYTATLSITASGYPAVSLPVTMVVKGPAPAIVPAPASASFNFVTGGPTPAKQTITVSSSGAAIPISIRSSGAGWLKLSRDAGVAVAGAPLILDLSVDSAAIASMTPKSYAAAVTLTTSDATIAPVTLPVTLTIIQGAPIISTLWPTPLPVNATNAVLTLSGSNFFPSSVVRIGASTIPAASVTFVSGSTLFVAVPASVLSVAGSYSVTVQNGSTVSGPAVFQVAASGAVLNAVLNVASYLDTPSATVSPGEIVSLFGSGLGPIDLTPATVSGGVFPTRIAQTQVEFETAPGVWTPAPLIFVRSDQINAVVPFGVSAATTQVRVTADASAIPPIYATRAVTFAAAHPGLFTVDGSGAGQAIVLNVSDSGTLALNSKQNPAPKGKPIVIYVSGAGVFAPPPTDGEVISVTPPALPPLTAVPATVTVDGVNCPVTYSGGVDGSIAGLVQVNCTLDSSQPAKDAAPIVVSFGATTTQPGTTMAVK